MSNELESTASDVSAESSSETPSSPEKTSEAPVTQEGKSTEKYVPYERFQEIIQQKNEFVKRLEEHEARYKALEERVSRPREEPKKAENPLLGRLKGIDPEFGQWAEQMEASRAELQALRDWRTQAEAERTRAEAQNELSRLHTQYKVSDDLKEHYNMFLRNEVSKIEASGKVLGIKDLASIYKSVHENVNKVFETQRRANIANYATSKKTDATPALKKGEAPKQAPGKFKYSKDPEEARAQIVKQTMERARAAKNSL